MKKKSQLKSTVKNIDSIQEKLTEVDKTFEEEKVKLNERKGHLTSLEKEKKDLQLKLAKM